MAEHRKKIPSFAGSFLKSYRNQQRLTQEQLAEELKIEPRTLRAWENGERQLNSIKEIHRIADLLGIDAEQMGLAGSVYIPRTPEEIEEIIKRIWSLIRESRIPEASRIIECLIQTLQSQIITEDPKLLHNLAEAQHVAGHIASLTSSANQSYKAIPYYHEMEIIARQINDQTQLNVALTYQGDMYRRLGETTRAIAYLEGAKDTTPNADIAAKGNNSQLLARAYLRKKDLENFSREIEKAEEATYHFNPDTSSTQGHYHLGLVYEEYGRSYADLGQMEKALLYLDRAKATLPPTKLWELLIKTAKALALVKGGELHEGVGLAVETTKELYEINNLRYLDRIRIIEQYLNKTEEYHARKQREIRKISIPLQEALRGEPVTEI